MEHPAFSEAGSNPGLEVWTIDNFEPVAIDQNKYGKFFNGDSYIVLKTTGDNTSTFAYDAHFWLGSKTTQDKMGSAAILTVTLDDMLGGKAVHHREVQGHESSLFLGYFRPAIRYLEGGNESGFNQVEINAGAEKRLLRLSGCENMRIEEVPADASALNRDNCFILEVDHDIYVLIPEGSRASQRRKIISVANKLRDDEHNGRAAIEIIDEFSSDEDVAMFFEALGSGSKEDLVEMQDDETYSRDSVSAVYLYKVLVGDELELDVLNKPYKQKALTSDGIYILDTPDSGVFVWIGRDVDADTRKNYNDVAQKYLDLKGYPAWVQVTRVTQGSECSTFKQYFHNWDTITTNSFVTESDAGYFSSDADEVAATAYRIGKSAPARGFMPDDGEGSLRTYKVAAGDVDEITELLLPDLPVLYQSEVYVVSYQCSSDDDDYYVIYLWIGSESSEEDRRAGVELAKETEDDMGDATFVLVPQGKEPKHFLRIFEGHLAIMLGSSKDGYRNYRGSYDEDEVRLFRVEGTELGVDMRTVQVPETADVLVDDDVFVLETAGAVYVRNGKESDSQEQEAALGFVKAKFGEEKEVTVVAQGEEPEEFWDALGGAPEEREDNSSWKAAVSRRVTTPPSLYAASVSVTGRIRAEELPPTFTQQDLSDDGVYILDVGEELYMWEGANIPERVKMARVDIIQEYIKDDGLDRTLATTLTVCVKQDKEPGAFKRFFPEWDDDMWTNQASYEDIKNEIKAANSK